MTVAIILGIIIVIALVFAAELLSLHKAAPPTSDLISLKANLSAPDAYRPMQRLFSEDDSAYLAARGGADPKVLRKLRNARRKSMFLYLGQVRRDFRTTWSICRFLAPFSDDPEFGTLLARQLVVFYGLYLMVSLRCLLGACGYVQLDITSLIDVVTSMRQAALGAFESTEGLAFQQTSS
jgi:hypothetical protein